MFRQPSLFGPDRTGRDEYQAAGAGPIPPRDPNAIKADRPRLTGQNAAILARLREGQASNSELARLSLKYTSRVSDLRAAGYAVEARRLPGGLTMYRLTEG